MSLDSKNLMDINNFIWSPPEGKDEEEFLNEIRSQLVQNIPDRGRQCWTRSPLNLAVFKLKHTLVRIMVLEIGIDVNSVDEMMDCQRSGLTIAISRAKADLERSVEMVKILVEELGADVNQTLKWKCRDKKANFEEVREFTPLLWAIFRNQPEMAKLLLELGANPLAQGCFLDAGKNWVCGNALGLAKKTNSHPDIVKLLESYGEKKRKESTTIIQIGKPNWKQLINPLSIELDSRISSALHLQNQIQELLEDPSYMTPEQIKAERRAIEEKQKNLEWRIQNSLRIESEIAKLKLDEDYLSQDELFKSLSKNNVIFSEGHTLN